MSLLLLLFLHLVSAATAKQPAPAPPLPPLWPEQFHAVVLTNQTALGGRLQLIDLYYDWPRRRDLNVIRDQLSAGALWNVEWANGTSFLFDAASSYCQTFHFAVGLLPPDWAAQGAAYLGRARLDGFDCHVWSNFVFERYYVDVATGRPVGWTYNGTQRHVVIFEEGQVLEDESKWQAPAYCFDGTNAGAAAGSAAASPMPEIRSPAGGSSGRSLRVI